MTKKGAACVEVAMNRYLAQSVLFDSLPRRVNLLNLGLEAPPVGSVETVVNVWRNHSFEPLQRLVSEYSAFRSWSLIFHLSSSVCTKPCTLLCGEQITVLWTLRNAVDVCL